MHLNPSSNSALQSRFPSAAIGRATHLLDPPTGYIYIPWPETRFFSLGVFPGSIDSRDCPLLLAIHSF
ncbi:hypothetical protein BJY01DRAFT_71815 [Aspergillus pseudoustus]|uniref:Uncharacterized protein n=1 Tax=Aspergillus pseudoustus TaxID=1810923 RepID=A0ABR4L0J4_9EURO